MLDLQTNSTCVSTKSTDFEFWADQRSNIYDQYGDNYIYEHEAVEFQSHTPLWSTRNKINGHEASSPLLPQNHHYSYPSPTSRLQAIVDGRRELMEMIRDLPESSYELSLKDMVNDEKISTEASKDDGVVSKREMIYENKTGSVQKKVRSNGSRGPISRCESMDSGVFLLKMFFPVSLGLNKKPKSKICRSKSFEGSEKKVCKDWWKMRFSGVRRVDGSSSSSSRSSSTNSNSSRNTASNVTPRFWSFSMKKCKSTGQPGCFF